MNAQSFVEHFGHLASAPDGVKRLRDLVSYFAITGGLSTHHAGDSDATTLASETLQAKQQYLETSNIRRSKRKNAELRQTVAQIPERWIFLPAGDLVDLINGRAFKTSDWKPTGLPIVRIQNLNNPNAPYNHYQGEVSDGHRVEQGDMLLSWSGTPGTSFGAFIWGGGEAVLNQHIFKVIIFSSLIDREYLRIAINACLDALIESARGGVGLKHVTKGQIEALQIPCPPLEEQKRIVAKVDELVAFCDTLEAQQEERQRLFPALSRACNASFADSPTPATLKRVFDGPGSVSPIDMRKTVLSIALQGVLVPQEPGDESVDALLDRCERERIECGCSNIRKTNTSNTGLGYSIPKSWRWRTLQDLLIFGPTNGISPKAAKHETSTRSLKLTATTSGRFKGEHSKYVDLEVPSDSELWLRDGDVLVQRGNSIDYVGVAAIYRGDENQFIYPDLMMKCRVSTELYVDFIHMAMSQEAARQYLRNRASGTSGSMPKINQSTLKSLPIPVPPLSEQKRIVAKVEELMELVDNIEKLQKRSKELAASSAQSVFSALTGAEFNPELERMKKQSDETFEERIYPKQPEFPFSGLVLREVKLITAYRSLGRTDFEFHYDVDTPEAAAPICLVGLNGSGKSNLLEAIADIFCYLELINLPWESIPDKYQRNDHMFELTYTLQNADSVRRVKIAKSKKEGADFFVVSDEGEESRVTDPLERIRLLPRRIVGYSSGLNETLSHPFLRTRTMYSEEVQKAAPPNDVTIEGINPVFNTRSLYMDYENNAEILICNCIFRTTEELRFIKDYTRVEGVSKFALKFKRKIAGKSGDAAIARLTNELKDYLLKFALCAGEEVDAESNEPHEFRYTLDRKTKAAFKKHFESAENLFLAMYKWSLLNALVLSREQRNVFLKEDVTKGTLERPPVVPPKDRLFDVSDVKVTLSQPKIEIDYSGLSDGEHQFVQVFGTILLFNEPGTLFLLDEPESHFNPEWRTKFNSILNKLPNAKTHEYVISTHSPYIVSGSREENVYKFERNGAKVSCTPINFETYGAEFDKLLNKLFSINSLIDKGAKEELEEILSSGNLKDWEKAVGDFAESDEKRRLYEAILREREKA